MIEWQGIDEIKGVNKIIMLGGFIIVGGTNCGQPDHRKSIVPTREGYLGPHHHEQLCPDHLFQHHHRSLHIKPTGGRQLMAKEVKRGGSARLTYVAAKQTEEAAGAVTGTVSLPLSVSFILLCALRVKSGEAPRGVCLRTFPP